MRTFGAALLLVGGAGYVYCSDRLAEVPPLPQGLSIERAVEMPAGRWQIGEYASAFVGVAGLLFVMFPKGR
jgi:hypothetical protein